MKNPAIARSARRLRLLVWAGAGLIVAIWLLAKFGPQVGPVRVETHTAALGAAGRAIVDLTLLLFVVALARLAQSGEMRNRADWQHQPGGDLALPKADIVTLA